MSIITWMGSSVSAYLEGRYAWWDAVLDTQRCSQCKCLCRRHSVRERAAWTQFLLRASERIPLMRIYCPQCFATYTVLPDFLTPRHRYQVLVREAAVTSAESVPPCCTQTVRRWRKAFGAAITMAVHHVTSLLLYEAVTLCHQDQRFLTGELRGYGGLRQVRRIAARYGFDTVASSLFGWINQACWSKQAFYL
jgi:hypothetical protein